MNKVELLQKAKPILFNTEMVQAILENKKTVTRRIVKNAEIEIKNNYVTIQGLDRYGEHIDNDSCGFPYTNNEEITRYMNGNYAPYEIGDILYVRETWTVEGVEFEEDKWIAYIGYKVEGNTQLGYQTKMEIKEDEVEKYKEYLYGEAEFKPSIHMPKKAARIFLKVTDVKVERLLDMSIEDMIREGVKVSDITTNRGIIKYRVVNRFQELWDSTIKKKELDMYGMDANPWVWVIEFERI